MQSAPCGPSACPCLPTHLFPHPCAEDKARFASELAAWREANPEAAERRDAAKAARRAAKEAAKEAAQARKKAAKKAASKKAGSGGWLQCGSAGANPEREIQSLAWSDCCKPVAGMGRSSRCGARQVRMGKHSTHPSFSHTLCTVGSTKGGKKKAAGSKRKAEEEEEAEASEEEEGPEGSDAEVGTASGDHGIQQCGGHGNA